jgi:succinoglycan biosynthesis transport protein ExoP
MATSAQHGFGFDDAAAMVRRRGGLALVVFLTLSSVVLGVVPFLPNIYQSTATVLVDRQQVPEAFVRSTVTSALETRLNTITQEILSRSRLDDLITRFGLYADLRRRVSPEAVIERMRKDIRFEVKGVDPTAREQSAVAFKITYRGSEPQAVALVANTLASFYIEENLKVRERQATGTTEFLKAQVMETKKRLDEQERQLSEYKSRHLGEMPQFMDANLATLERLHSQLRFNSDSQIRIMERHDALARQLGDRDGAGAEAPGDRLLRLKQELAQLRTQFRDGYPDIVRVKAEIAALQREIEAAPADGKAAAPAPFRSGPVGHAMSGVDAELKALKSDEAKLRAAISDYEGRMQNLPRREQEYQEVSRDYQTTKDVYRALMIRYEEAQVAESMEQRQKGEQFRIIDPATPSELPAAPKRVRLVLTGLGLALGLAVATVVVAEKLDTSFHTAEALAAFTSVPILISITQIVSEVETARRRRRAGLVALSTTVGVAAALAVSYFIARGNEQLVWMLSSLGGAPHV